MKTTARVLCTLIFLVSVFSTKSLTKKTEIVSEISPGGFVYIGMDNPVKISVAGVASNDLVVTVSGGAMLSKMEGNGRFCLRAMSMAADSVSVSVSHKSGTKLVLDGKRSFKLKRVPIPYVKLGSKKNGETISKAELKIVNFLLVVADWDVTTVKFAVKSYTLDINGKTFNVPSGRITDEIREVILKKNPNKLKFTAIKGIGPDGTSATFPDTEINVGS